MTLQEVLSDPEFYQNNVDYLEGHLTSEEIVEFAKVHDVKGIPFQGARILERAMASGHVPRTADNLYLTAKLYETAREREMAMPFLKAAMDVSPSAEIAKSYVRVAIRLDACEWADSVVSKELFELSGAERFALAKCFENPLGNPKYNCEFVFGSKFTESSRDLLKARDYYSKIKGTDTLYLEALSSMAQIRRSLEFNKCECDPWCGENRVIKDICFNDIAMAYKSRPASESKLELNEPKCQRYVEEFNSINLKKSD